MSTLEQVLAATRWTVGGRSGGDLLPWSRLNTTIRALCQQFRITCKRSSAIGIRGRTGVGSKTDIFVIGALPALPAWGRVRRSATGRSGDGHSVCVLEPMGVAMTAKGAPSELLAAFVIDCRCGERLLLGGAFGVLGAEETAAWRATLDDVARRLAVPLLWGRDQELCPRCGAQVSRVSSAVATRASRRN